MSRHLRLSLACFVFALLSISVVAQTPPSADTYVARISPSTNYGSAPMLAVQEGTTAYLQFDLSALPSDANINKATLRLYVNGVLTPGAFDVYQVNDKWSESMLNYNDTPSLGDSATGENPIQVSESSIGHFVAVDVTWLARAWVSKAVSNNGVALALAGDATSKLGSFSFDSRESSLPEHQPGLAIVLSTGCHASQGPGGYQSDACDPNPMKWCCNCSVTLDCKTYDPPKNAKEYDKDFAECQKFCDPNNGNFDPEWECKPNKQRASRIK